MIIIDECHRVSGDESSQYQTIIELLRPARHFGSVEVTTSSKRPLYVLWNNVA